MKMITYLICIFILVSGCSETAGPHKPIEQGAFKTQKGAGGSGPDYSDVKPVFAQFCSGCHPSRSAPDWLEYSQAMPFVKNGALKNRVVIEKSMPPGGSREAALIGDAQRNLIAKWIEAGAPEVSKKTTAPSNQINEDFDPSKNQPPAYVSSCLHCHGASGPQGGARGDIPKLGGQSVAYLNRQIHNFKWLERVDPSYEMNQNVATLNPEMIHKISKYFANFSDMSDLAIDSMPKLNEERQHLYNQGRALAEASCNSCHMNAQTNYRPQADLVPALRNQNEQYLTNQLIYFKKGLRKNAFMQSISEKLSKQEIQALSLYYSNFHPQK